MSALRKAGIWLGLVEEDDDRGYDDRGYRERSSRGRDRHRYSGDRYADEFADGDDEVEDERSVPRARTERSRISDRLSARADHDRVERPERANVRSITRPPPSGDSAASSSYATRDNLAPAARPAHQPQVHQRPAEEEQRYQIITVHPTTYRDARTIGEHFRDGTPVIINLTQMDEEHAYQVVDFAAGLAFGLRGTLERVTNRVFLLSPAHVQVTAKDKATIAEGGFFTQS